MCIDNIVTIPPSKNAIFLIFISFLRTGDAIDYQICGTLFFTRLFYDSRGPRIPTFTVNIHFRGFRTHGGVPWDPFFVLPLKSLILHQVGVFACWRRVFCWKCLKPSPGGLQDPLSLPIEEKKFFVDKWPQNHRDFAKILSGSDFARGRGKVVLSRAQKLKNNICSWVLGDWDLV